MPLLCKLKSKRVSISRLTSLQAVSKSNESATGFTKHADNRLNQYSAVSFLTFSSKGGNGAKERKGETNLSRKLMEKRLLSEGVGFRDTRTHGHTDT